MADISDVRRLHAVVLIVLSLGLITFPVTSTTVAVDSEAHGHELDFKHRHVSAFVRKHLDADVDGSGGDQCSSTPVTKSSSHRHAIISSSSRARRLAGTANCSSTPGFCNTTSFPAGSVCCSFNGICADVQNDKNNCGICSFICAGSLGCCNGTCTSFSTDNRNCGGCGLVCKNSLCNAGMCGYGG